MKADANISWLSGELTCGMNDEFNVKPPRGTNKKAQKHTTLVIQSVTFLGWLSDPFKGLSDLQLGDEKGTLNHLDMVFVSDMMMT